MEVLIVKLSGEHRWLLIKGYNVLHLTQIQRKRENMRGREMENTRKRLRKQGGRAEGRTRDGKRACKGEIRVRG